MSVLPIQLPLSYSCILGSQPPNLTFSLNIVYQLSCRLEVLMFVTISLCVSSDSFTILWYRHGEVIYII